MRHHPRATRGASSAETAAEERRACTWHSHSAQCTAERRAFNWHSRATGDVPEHGAPPHAIRQSAPQGGAPPSQRWCAPGARTTSCQLRTFPQWRTVPENELQRILARTAHNEDPPKSAQPTGLTHKPAKCRERKLWNEDCPPQPTPLKPPRVAFWCGFSCLSCAHLRKAVHP